jgi:hypothetical protein
MKKVCPPKIRALVREGHQARIPASHIVSIHRSTKLGKRRYMVSSLGSPSPGLHSSAATAPDGNYRPAIGGPNPPRLRCHRVLLLGAPESCVAPLFPEQEFVRTALDNRSCVEHDDFIRTHDRREPARNDQGGTAPRDFLEIVQDLALGRTVQEDVASSKT